MLAQDTLPLIRRHFTPEEVRPTAKQISKAYGLMDMGEMERRGSQQSNSQGDGANAGVACRWSTALIVGHSQDPSWVDLRRDLAVLAAPHPNPRPILPNPFPQATTCAR